MKKFLSLLLALTVCCSIVLAKEVIVLTSTGNVLLWKSNQWIQADKGMVLTEKQEIKTLEKSKAALLFSDGSTITLTENTHLKIEDLLSNKFSVYLVSGKLYSKVKPLQKSQVFEVKTPVSVASVRGTEFIVSYINNNSELIVVEGSVLFSDISGKSIEVGELETCSILESSGLTEKFNLSKEQVNEMLNEFKDIEVETENFEQKEEKAQQEEQQTQEATEETRKKDEFVELRNELKEFISDVKLEGYYITETIQQVKEADFQTGRTLIDVHGNLTRVEQTITRNKNNTVEFVNITKRDNYKYKGYFKDYTNEVNTNKPKIDILKLGIEFNTSLPEDISEWPKFIADKTAKDEDFFPTKIYAQLSNNFEDSFLQEVNFKKITKDGEEKLEGEGKILISIREDNVKKEYKIDPDKKDGLPESSEKKNDDGKLWAWAQNPVWYDNGSGGNGVLWICTEGYLISNNGEILTPSYFAGGSNKDPFTILKEIAFESIIFVRKDNEGKPGDNLFNSNIDLVATPDIVLALVKKIAPSLSKLDIEKIKK